MVSDAMIQAAVAYLNAQMTHMGIGNGEVPDSDDEVMSDELLRKAVTSYIDGNVVIKEVYLDETELNGEDLTAVGVYGDSSSVLYCGGGINQTKEAGESLTISVELTVGRE